MPAFDMTPTSIALSDTTPSDPDGLQARVVELETRLAFQEHALQEMSDALAEFRGEAARSADLLRRVLDELKTNRGDSMANAADEPPPPHY